MKLPVNLTEGSILRTYVFLVYLILSFPFQIHGQIDNVGSGRALRFDGVDDYIDLGNVYDDLNFPFTISAWVFIDASQASPSGIFDSQNTLDTHYNGFWFAASPSGIFIEYGDGKGTNHPAFRGGKGLVGLDIAGRWNHVSAVVTDVSRIDIYLNGYNMGGTPSGNSSLPMASSFPNDDAHIGNHFVNGIHYHFKGLIDELRIFNRSLSETEIRQQMCRSLAGDEPGLIGYWTFDENGGNTLKDSSPKGYDGILMGNPTRVFSGAPIGDESVFLYTSNWSGAILTENDISVEDVSGNPFGIHIYKVNDFPSQTIGLDASTVRKPYYGIFVADENDGNTFTVRRNNTCKAFYRDDNSQPVWATSDQFNHIQNRKEIIFHGGDDIDFQISLGENRTICDKTSEVLSTALTDTNDKTFVWSTGESSPSITVVQSGLYSVSVTQGCTTHQDSVLLSFLESPPVFSLGEDEALCDLDARNLQPAIGEGFEWQWSDGSTGQNFVVTDWGTYWLKVENACGSSVDSIRFSKLEIDLKQIPNCITPNGDVLNQHFILPESFRGSSISIYNRWGSEVYRSTDYNNTWDAHDLASGVYFYILNTKCTTNTKGVIHVLR